jgi:hypothetical protein
MRLCKWEDPMRQTNTKRRYELLDILGAKCACGYDDKRALQLDHINGGGNAQVNKLGSKSNVYKYYLENPEFIERDLQVLCANCNWIKRHTHKELQRV